MSWLLSLSVPKNKTKLIYFHKRFNKIFEKRRDKENFLFEIIFQIKFSILFLSCLLNCFRLKSIPESFHRGCKKGSKLKHSRYLEKRMLIPTKLLTQQKLNSTNVN